MPLTEHSNDDYFGMIANRVEINRCPTCDVGMVIDTPTDRKCPKCGYSDSSNVPLKARLRFKLHQEKTINNIRNCAVIAYEPNGSISFIKQFVDTMTAQSYIDKMKEVCL